MKKTLLVIVGLVMVCGSVFANSVREQQAANATNSESIKEWVSTTPGLRDFVRYCTRIRDMEFYGMTKEVYLNGITGEIPEWAEKRIEKMIRLGKFAEVTFAEIKAVVDELDVIVLEQVRRSKIKTHADGRVNTGIIGEEVFFAAKDELHELINILHSEGSELFENKGPIVMWETTNGQDGFTPYILTYWRAMNIENELPKEVVVLNTPPVQVGLKTKLVSNGNISFTPLQISNLAAAGYKSVEILQLNENGTSYEDAIINVEADGPVIIETE